jgi:hypothetical protein
LVPSAAFTYPSQDTVANIEKWDPRLATQLTELRDFNRHFQAIGLADSCVVHQNSS